MPTIAPITSVTATQFQLLLTVARRALNPTNPEALVLNQPLFLAQIMANADWKAVTAVSSILGEEGYKTVLQTAPTGVFNYSAWHFWHKRFKLDVPPLPAGLHAHTPLGLRPPKNFPDQFKIGLEGEKLMLDKYHQTLGTIKPVGRESDIFLATIQLHQEHKTDSYDMRKTLNFFIESISDRDANTIGGPARAVAHRVPLFSYLFSEQKICYWFSAQTLHTLTQKYVTDHHLPLSDVFNEDKHTGRTWYTQGYKIPREYLEPYAIAIHDLSRPIDQRLVTPIVVWGTQNGHSFQPGKHPKNLPIPARQANPVPSLMTR